MTSNEPTIDQNTKLSELTDRQILELTQGVESTLPDMFYQSKMTQQSRR